MGDKSTSPEDAKLLRACIAFYKHRDEVESLDENEAKHLAAFESMYALYRPLSSKQKSYLKGIFERLFDEPLYENAFSAGKIPLGEALKTPVPEVLLKPLPMKPPGR